MDVVWDVCSTALPQSITSAATRFAATRPDPDPSFAGSFPGGILTPAQHVPPRRDGRHLKPFTPRDMTTTWELALLTDLSKQQAAIAGA
jgi:hypothetical protein